jgi:integrase
MGVKVRISHGKIFLDIYTAGRRKWESTGLSVSTNPRQQKEVMQLAEIIRSKRETQIVAAKYNIPDPIAHKKTLYAYMSEYAKNLPKKHPVRYSLTHLEKYPGGKVVKLSEINPLWIENYRNYLIKDCGIGMTTASNYFKGLRQTLNKAVRENVITTNPSSMAKCIKKSDPNRVFLTEEELQQLGKTPPPPSPDGEEVKKAFIFSCYTGLRISDLKTLKWKHLIHTESETKLLKRQKKTKDNLYNLIPGSAWTLLATKPNQDPETYVFHHLASIQSSCNQLLAKWGENAGINRRISWHVARRTFAMRLLENGVDIYTISKLLGHTSITTTVAYLKLSSKLSKMAIENVKEIKTSDSESHPPDPSVHNSQTDDSETQKPLNP